jgi:hypothetical protein
MHNMFTHTILPNNRVARLEFPDKSARTGGVPKQIR